MLHSTGHQKSFIFDENIRRDATGSGHKMPRIIITSVVHLSRHANCQLKICEVIHWIDYLDEWWWTVSSVNNKVSDVDQKSSRKGRSVGGGDRLSSPSVINKITERTAGFQWSSFELLERSDLLSEI